MLGKKYNTLKLKIFDCIRLLRVFEDSLRMFNVAYEIFLSNNKQNRKKECWNCKKYDPSLLQN